MEIRILNLNFPTHCKKKEEEKTEKCILNIPLTQFECVHLFFPVCPLLLFVIKWGETALCFTFMFFNFVSKFPHNAPI